MAELESLDAPLQARLREIVQERGWPTRSQVADDGAHAAWLVLQHSDAEFQKEILPSLIEAAENGQARKADAAYLRDRVLMREGKPQIYGTQVRYSDEEGMELYPIEDEADVDRRRAEVGLEPLFYYLQRQGIAYSPPAPSGGE